MSVPDSIADGPLKGVSGNSSVQDSAPRRGYPHVLVLSLSTGPTSKSSESSSSYQLCAENHQLRKAQKTGCLLIVILK